MPTSPHLAEAWLRLRSRHARPEDIVLLEHESADLRGLFETRETTVGMMVVGRKVAESADEVRYEFGLDRQFDRVLTIDKHKWQMAAEDG